MFEQSALVCEISKLHKFSLKLTRNPHNAEDLLQATLLRALEKKDFFEEGSNLFGWTSKIMFNLFVTGYRQKNRYESQYDPEPYINQVSVEPNQEACVDLITVQDNIKKLSKEHREILLLVCTKEMRYEEVSEMLQIPVGTVRSRLSRARTHLQESMETPREKHYALSHQKQAHRQNVA